MQINYIKHLREEKVLAPNSLPDLTDEQAETIYCDHVRQFLELRSHYFDSTFIAMIPLCGTFMFSSMILLEDDLTKLQTILVVMGLVPFLLSWMYFSIGMYILTFRQSIIEKSLDFVEGEYPHIKKYLSNKLVSEHYFRGYNRLSYSRALPLSLMILPIYGLSFLGLTHFEIVDTEDRLSSALICIYMLVAFFSLNCLYIKCCKMKKM